MCNIGMLLASHYVPKNSLSIIVRAKYAMKGKTQCCKSCLIIDNTSQWVGLLLALQFSYHSNLLVESAEGHLWASRARLPLSYSPHYQPPCTWHKAGHRVGAGTCLSHHHIEACQLLRGSEASLRLSSTISFACGGPGICSNFVDFGSLSFWNETVKLYLQYPLSFSV